MYALEQYFLIIHSGTVIEGFGRLSNRIYASFLRNGQSMTDSKQVDICDRPTSQPLRSRGMARRLPTHSCMTDIPSIAPLETRKINMSAHYTPLVSASKNALGAVCYSASLYSSI
jgi:hypothetical protein